MEINKAYTPSAIEEKWYQHWTDKNYFHSEPDERTPYSIVIPPPNVTGVLHMGHMLNNTLQDVLIRKARLQGFNACWVPGTDHASIATEAKVVRRLREKGITKKDLTRDEFLSHAWEWKEEHGGIILEQLKKLGASADWERTRFTMEPKLSKAVVKVFVDLYNKGYIYRGLRMVNWDPKALTALSDEEVIFKESQSKLYHVRYQVEGSEEYLTIATTRPETILGDTAICIHPEDERWEHIRGKRAIVPLINRSIPIIQDEYVDMEFGSGCLKVTPAHDKNDHELGQKHNLEVIDILTDDAKLNEKAQLFVGEDRFKARKSVVAALEELGLIAKVETLQNSIGRSERTDEVIEPKLSMQWYVAMEKLAGPALENVMNDQVQFFPAKYKNVYRHWMENIKDWCISRQLWWGQQIPAWYIVKDANESVNETDFVVAETEAEALALAKEKDPTITADQLKRDEDVVDTWFSSWLWPISVFDGFEADGGDVDYYYPTNVLVTGWDIIFFWVARMIMAGYEWKNELPFKQVYFTGMVRDPKGRKMSKQLGNSPDPLDLIAKYGADGVRTGMLFCAPAGNDLLFDEKLCEQGRNFANKIWNATRLMQSWKVEAGTNPKNEPCIAWFENKLSQTITQLERSFETFHVSEALKTLYSFIWTDYCSWFLEMIKPDYETAIDKYTYDKAISFFEQALQLAHPFMPFITEEIWHIIRERREGEDITVSKWPTATPLKKELLDKGELIKEITTKTRDIRNKNQVKPKELVTLSIKSSDANYYAPLIPSLTKLAGIASVQMVDDEVEGATSFIANKDQFFVATPNVVDPAQEKIRLLDEKKYYEGFIQSISKKLGNERFVNGAPEAVVNKERQKLADGEDKLKMIETSLAKL